MNPNSPKPWIAEHDFEARASCRIALQHRIDIFTNKVEHKPQLLIQRPSPAGCRELKSRLCNRRFQSPAPCLSRSGRYSDCLRLQSQCLLAQRLKQDARQVAFTEIRQNRNDEFAGVLGPGGNLQRRSHRGA